MQLLYGNDRRDYRVIAKSPDLTENIAKQLEKSGFLYYGYAKGTYSSVEQEPIALSCVCTKLNGIFQEKKLLVSKAAKMRNRETPSYYAHVQITDMPEQIDDQYLQKILDRVFISEDEMLDYETKKDIDQFQIKENFDETWDRNGLSQDYLYRILLYIFESSETIGQVVTVISDDSGDGYNRRAKEILYAIYNRLPYFFREIIGFTTYYSPNSSGMMGIGIRIVEKGTNIQGMPYVVDLNSEPKKQKSANEWGHVVEKIINKDKITQQNLLLWKKYLPVGGSAEKYLSVLKKYEDYYKELNKKNWENKNDTYSMGCYILLKKENNKEEFILPEEEMPTELMDELKNILRECHFFDEVQKWKRTDLSDVYAPRMLITIKTKKGDYERDYVLYIKTPYEKEIGDKNWIFVRWMKRKPQDVLLEEYKDAYAELTEYEIKWRNNKKLDKSLEANTILMVAMLLSDQFLEQKIGINIHEPESPSDKHRATDWLNAFYNVFPGRMLYEWGYRINIEKCRNKIGVYNNKKEEPNAGIYAISGIINHTDPFFFKIYKAVAKIIFTDSMLSIADMFSIEQQAKMNEKELLKHIREQIMIFADKEINNEKR